jgi:hypothetical protein
MYWTQCVIQHKGAPLLRSALLDMNCYQYLLLDIIAVLALALGSVLLIVYTTLRTVYGKTCGDTRHKKDEKILRKKKMN